MFNGIVEEIGIVTRVEKKKNLTVLSVRASKVTKGTKAGDSIAVDGVCLTVTSIRKGILVFDLMAETLSTTTLGVLKSKSKVNLERSLKYGARVSGHFVTGHVDKVIPIRKKITGANYTEFQLAIPKPLARHLVLKGSVCLDGVSLTVGALRKSSFSVHLIPFTKEVTTLGLKKEGDRVNIETDVLAKYAHS